MAKTGRPKKPTAMLKYEETYREDRAGRRADTEITLPVKSIDCPVTITNERAINAFNATIPSLCQLNLISIQDLPELELAFLALQEVYLIQDDLSEARSKRLTDKNRDTIDNLNKSLMRSIKMTDTLLQRFAMSPVGRTNIVFEAAKIKEIRSVVDEVIGV